MIDPRPIIGYASGRGDWFVCVACKGEFVVDDRALNTDDPLLAGDLSNDEFGMACLFCESVLVEPLLAPIDLRKVQH